PPWPWVLAAETNDGTQWLVWSVVVAAAVAIAQPPERRIAFLWGSALLVAQTWLMLTNLRARWDSVETAMHVTASAAILIATFAVLSRSLRSGNARVVWVLLAALVLDGVVLVYGGSLLLAQLAG